LEEEIDLPKLAAEVCFGEIVYGDSLCHPCHRHSRRPAEFEEVCIAYDLSEPVESTVRYAYSGETAVASDGGVYNSTVGMLDRITEGVVYFHDERFGAEAG
jgi:hypothetical protein